MIQPAAVTRKTLFLLHFRGVVGVLKGMAVVILKEKEDDDDPVPRSFFYG